MRWRDIRAGKVATGLTPDRRSKMRHKRAMWKVLRARREKRRVIDEMSPEQYLAWLETELDERLIFSTPSGG